MMRSLVISIFLYACESWTLTAVFKRRVQITEMRCYRRLLGISCKIHITNAEVRKMDTNAVDLLTTTKRQKKVVWGCQKIQRACQYNPKRNCTRKEKERQTEKKNGRTTTQSGQEMRCDNLNRWRRERNGVLWLPDAVMPLRWL